MTVPATGRQEFVKPNHQVSRDERESLYSVLPRIHAATLQLIASILNRFGTAMLSVLPSLTEQLTWVFKAERADEQFRTVAYNTLRQILEFAGHAFGKDEIADITPFIAACCFDMLPEDDRTRLPTSQNVVQQSGSQAASQGFKSATISSLISLLFKLLHPHCCQSSCQTSTRSVSHASSAPRLTAPLS